MRLMTRLKKIERKAGPLTLEECHEAGHRQRDRLQNALHRAKFKHWVAWMKKYPGREDGPTENELSNIDLPEPPLVDMSADGFARDQDIIDAFCTEEQTSWTFAIGRSEKEMLKHYFSVAAKAERDRRSRSQSGDAP